MTLLSLQTPRCASEVGRDPHRARGGGGPVMGLGVAGQGV